MRLIQPPPSLTVFFKIVLIIFCSELAIMFFFNPLAMSILPGLALNSSMVALFTVLPIWYFVFKPTHRLLSQFKRHYESHKAAALADHVVFTLSPDLRILEVNHLGLGLAKTPEGSILGQSVFDGSLQHFFMPIKTELQHCLNTLQAIQVNHSSLSRSQQPLFFETSLYPQLDPENNLEEILMISTDVTERSLWSEKIRERSEYYEMILNTMNEGYLVENNNGEVLSSNKSVWSILGPQRQNDGQGISKSIDSLRDELGQVIGQKDLPAYKVLNNDLGSAQTTLQMVDKMGNKQWLRIASKPLLFGASEKQALTTITDVSEEFRAHLLIRENEAELQEAQRVAQIGNWSIDLVSLHIRWSEQVFQIFGMAPSEASPLLSDIEARIHPDDLESWKDAIRRCFSTGQLNNVRFRVLRGSDVIWAEGRGQALRGQGGKFRTVFGTCQNIDAQVRSAQQREFLLRALRLGTWTWNLQTDQMEWDEKMYSLFLSEHADNKKRRELWLKKQSKSSQEQSEKIIQEAIKTENGFSTVLEIDTSASKSHRYLATRAHIERTADGTPISLYGVCWDHTHETELERSLIVEKQKMMQTSKLASLGEMAAGIAHEINNPLGVIDGQVALLRRSLVLEDKTKERLDSVKRSVDRILKIVNGLRKYSRTTDGQHREWKSFKHILEESMLIIESRLKKSDVSVSVELDSGVEIYCDEIEIEQVLINLLANSSDAIKEMPSRWIKVRGFIEGTQYKIHLSDSGKGIPQDVAEKIFDPFFTTKRTQEGTGLGLSICKGILDAHQASLYLLPQEQHTTFEISFQQWRAV